MRHTQRLNERTIQRPQTPRKHRSLFRKCGGLILVCHASYPPFMFSLRQLFGKQDRFFDLLERGAQESRRSVQAFGGFLSSPESVRNLDEFVVSRVREKRAFDELHELLATTFETGLEREDISALSLSLYRIPKILEKIAERIVSCPQFVRGLDLNRQIAMLDRATEILVQMVQALFGGAHLETVKKLNDELHQIEGDADKLMLDVFRDLYTGGRDAVAIVFLKDLYELLEKVFDRCRDAGNVITQIVLKSS